MHSSSQTRVIFEVLGMNQGTQKGVRETISEPRELKHLEFCVREVIKGTDKKIVTREKQ